MITATAADESCPGCGKIEGVELTRSTPRVVAWKRTRCGLCWAISAGQPLLPMVVTAHGRPDELRVCLQRLREVAVVLRGPHGPATVHHALRRAGAVADLDRVVARRRY